MIVVTHEGKAIMATRIGNAAVKSLTEILIRDNARLASAYYRAHTYLGENLSIAN
jgi:hypothetical protein